MVEKRTLTELVGETEQPAGKIGQQVIHGDRDSGVFRAIGVFILLHHVICKRLLVQFLCQVDHLRGDNAMPGRPIFRGGLLQFLQIGIGLPGDKIIGDVALWPIARNQHLHRPGAAGAGFSDDIDVLPALVVIVAQDDNNLAGQGRGKMFLPPGRAARASRRGEPTLAQKIGVFFALDDIHLFGGNDLRQMVQDRPRLVQAPAVRRFLQELFFAAGGVVFLHAHDGIDHLSGGVLIVIIRRDRVALVDQLIIPVFRGGRGDAQLAKDIHYRRNSRFNRRRQCHCHRRHGRLRWLCRGGLPRGRRSLLPGDVRAVLVAKVIGRFLQAHSARDGKQRRRSAVIAAFVITETAVVVKLDILPVAAPPDGRAAIAPDNRAKFALGHLAR